ncbi:MAG: channel protein TolC [Micavibrio sp.]|nr:MAG: channel protein TolC [Micavibrio sp.]
MNEAVGAALRHHPSVEAAQIGIGIANEQSREEFSGYFPELSASGTYGRVYGDNSTSRGLVTDRGAAYSYLGEGSFSIRQMIFDGLETPSRVQAAQTRTMQAGTNATDIRESIALRAAQAYVNVLRTRAGLEMLYAHRSQVDDYLNRIETMVNEGAGDEAELQQAKEIRVILAGIVKEYEGQTRAAEADYMEVTGHMPEGDMIKHSPRLDLVPAYADDATTFAKAHHPAVLASELEATASGHDIDAEKAVLYPDLDGELSYLKSDKDDVIGGEVVDARAVFRMNWNFSTGGAELARIKRKQLEHQESVAQMQEVHRQVERDVRLAYSEFETARAQYDLLGERVVLNSDLFETYQTQFEGARISQLQLMQAHNQLFNTLLEKMNGEHRLLASEYMILASVGRLQESLASPSPEAHEQN